MLVMLGKCDQYLQWQASNTVKPLEFDRIKESERMSPIIVRQVSDRPHTKSITTFSEVFNNIEF